MTTMPYVKRDENNNIVAIYQSPAANADEFLAADDIQLMNFLFKDEQGNSTKVHYQLTESDIKLIRAIEDIIDVLINKEVITITDLPESVLDKIQSRKAIRNKMKEITSMNLSEDPGESL